MIETLCRGWLNIGSSIVVWTSQALVKTFSVAVETNGPTYMVKITEKDLTVACVICMVLCALQQHVLSILIWSFRKNWIWLIAEPCMFPCSILPGSWMDNVRTSTCLKRPTKALVYHHVSPSIIPDMFVYTVITIVETTMSNMIPMLLVISVFLSCNTKNLTFIEPW
jgi:hypothetical protein